MSVTLEEVIRAGEARLAPVAGEMAGYLVLGAADQLQAASRRVEPREVLLEQDGTVRLTAGAGGATAAETEGDLRELLAELLTVARPLPPAMLRATRRNTGRGVEVLIRELESALIPVNRSASRRALSRLYREVVRAQAAGAIEVSRRDEAWPQRSSEPARAAAEPVAAPVAAPQAPAADPVAVEVVQVEPAVVTTPSEPAHGVTAEPHPEPAPAFEAVPPSRVEVAAEPFPEPDVLTVPQPVVSRQRAREAEQLRQRQVERSTTSTPAVFMSCVSPTSVLDYSQGPEATERVPDVLALHDEEPELIEPPAASEPLAEDGAVEAPVALDGADEELEPEEISAPPPLPEPRAEAMAEVAEVAEVEPEREPSTPAAPPRARGVQDRRSDVSELVTGFQVAETRDDFELSRALKHMVGIDLTPLPPDFRDAE